MQRSKYFVATGGDLRSRLEHIDAESALQYWRIDGARSTSDFEVYQSLLQWSHLGSSRTGIHSTDFCFLVAEADVHVHVREFRGRKGGVSYFVDQSTNPASIVFWPGGVDEPHECVVAGEVSTISEHPLSLELFKCVSRQITRGFTKVNRYYVGPGAIELYRRGYRLVPMGFDEPSGCDLVVPTISDEQAQ